MNLFYRRPSIKTREVMSQTALHIKHAPGNRYEEINRAEDSIKKFTHHEQVKIVNSGNSAILSVMSTFNSKIMIPDQGGWTGFKKMADFCGLETVILPTELGLVKTEILEDYIDKFNPEALFITSFAGYMAEQPLKDIYDICVNSGVVLVEDASGGIGDERGLLGNGLHAHIIIASTGTPKTVNVGNGGFVSTNDKQMIVSAKNILNSVKADPVTCAGIDSEIKNSPDILSKTMKACDFLKSEIIEFREVLYNNKMGLNVTIPDENPKKLGYELRNRINVQGGSIITICPNNNRVKLKSVCIEIKNLNVDCMVSKNLNQISQILKTLD